MIGVVKFHCEFISCDDGSPTAAPLGAPQTDFQPQRPCSTARITSLEVNTDPTDPSIAADFNSVLSAMKLGGEWTEVQDTYELAIPSSISYIHTAQGACLYRTKPTP